MNKNLATLILSYLVFLVGCESVDVYLVDPPPPTVPVADVPKELRQRNWESRASNKYGQGSCVHASTITMLRWHGEERLAEYWRKKYSGGETSVSITKFYRDNGIPYSSTMNERTYECSGDPAFLRDCSLTRRAAIIWWKPSHCCTFVGFSKVNGQEVAGIIDNNFPDRVEYVPVNEFITKWRSYGGFAATVISPKMPPTSPWPYPVILPKSGKDTAPFWN